MEQLVHCEHCGSEISDSALKCPVCWKQTVTNEALSSKIAKSAATASALVLLGPAAIAAALVTGPLMLHTNRQLKSLAKRLKCIDSFELTDGIHVFVTEHEFVPVLTSLGGAVRYPGFLRSDLHNVFVNEEASRPKGFMTRQRVVLELEYFDTGRRKREVTDRYSFTGKHARALAEFACLKFREYQAAS